MKEYLLPILLSALVMPGAGQFYNKEKIKGCVFLGLFVMVVLGFSTSLAVSLSAIIPTGVAPTPDQLRSAAEEIMANQGPFIKTFWYLILAIWGYSVIDAFLGARDLARARRDSPPPPVS